MPKMIDPEVKARAVRLVTEHWQEYASLTAAAEAVSKQLGLGRETVRSWVVQADVDAGRRDGVTSEELEEIKKLKAENRRLREDVAVLKRPCIACGAGTDHPCSSGSPSQPRACTGFSNADTPTPSDLDRLHRRYRKQGARTDF